MPIVNWRPSPRQTRAFQDGLDQLVMLKRIPSGLKIQPPLPIYSLGLRDAHMSRGFDDAGKRVGWRYFATGEKDVSGDIDLSANPKLTSLAYDEQVSLVLAALKLAEQSDEILGVEFEPRLLRIPGLLLECLWLSPLTPPGAGDGGWVVPYNKLTNELNSEKLYQGGELFSKLQNWAGATLRKGRVPITPRRPSPPQA